MCLYAESQYSLFLPSLNAEILSEDLQAGAEDEQDYEAPEKGNVLYKLYSLQDLLLMVRSSVSLTHTRRVGSTQNQVYMLLNTHPPEFLFLCIISLIKICSNSPISFLCLLPE